MKQVVAVWISENKYALCFVAIGLVYFFNLFIDVMEADAGQYAAISLEMFRTGSFLEIYHRGADYLDKPPLLFWLSSLSFNLFGVSNFSYKLPAVLILLLGIYSTYRFTLLWYDKKKAVFAALILCSTQAFFLMTNDIRTDGLLTGFVIFSLWQLSLFLRNEKFVHLMLGAIGIACALMTKGPIGLVIVGLAMWGDFILKRNWKAIFKWEWILMVVVIGILLLPMCYGLYQQFDLHPEKEVYGLQGPSGLRFFFWTQSFGRITGELYWKDDTGFFYFFHTILWDFQPWILLLIPALWKKIIDLIKDKFRVETSAEWISMCGFLFPFLALSTSGYKLPHYIFPLFPFLAIITADYIVEFSKTDNKFFAALARIQFGLMHLFFAISFFSFIYFFEPQWGIFPFVVVLLLILFWYSWLKVESIGDRIITTTLVAMISFGLVLSTYLYPTLLRYQAESVAAQEMHSKKIPSDMFYYYRSSAFSMDFYFREVLESADIKHMSNYKQGTYIFTDPDGVDEIINKEKLDYRIVKEYDDFHVARLNFKFLNRNTRNQVVQKKYLLEKI